MLKVLEYSWLFIMILGASFGTYKCMAENISSAIWFFILAAVACIFWIIRRNQRIRIQKKNR
jgi:hypothetical protein